MDILSSIQIDPVRWPLAVMIFLRIVTLLFFLPIFGDQAVPLKLKIALAIAFTFFVYPIVSNYVNQKDNLMQWSVVTLAIASLREVLFAFAVGFAAKMVIFGTSIASHIVGINMGFQVASMFSPGLNEHESSYFVLKNWIVLILLLTLNIHHLFIEGIVRSYIEIPIASNADSMSLVKVAIKIAQEAFVLGLRLASPLIAVQILINISLGLLNRALPSLNVFVISFPTSFIITMIILFVSVTSILNFLASYGMEREMTWFQNIQKAFIPSQIK